ncbi:MAG TPA: Yip1 family protein [Verrucomicrobiae bacterium]|nr:Yip1 family protein [Verrucomicrobiae bacterium]
MIKALFLIFEPEAAWEGVARAHRSLKSILLFYLLPMMLIVAAAEGYGLVVWGRWQSTVGAIKKFTPAEALLTEVLEVALMGAAIAVCAHLVKALSNTFRGGQTYAQTLTVVAYGLSPMFLCRLLDVAPTINLWIPWGIGLLLCVKILYHGVPRILQPDPPHAFGLFLMSTLLMAMVTGLERFIVAGYFNGTFKPLTAFVTQLAGRLPLGQ